MDEELVEIEIPSKTYKVANGMIAGYVDNLEAVRQAVDKTLATERFGWHIYSDGYGTELADLIGEQMDLVKAEIERVIEESLMADDRIQSIDDFTIIEETVNTLKVAFNVKTIFGEIRYETEVSA